ncbi:hypothetical protein BJ980_000011 [Nocardioides daedukensis]|uniref:Uncharacterized protein n=1 Tax=Nocardioides daedukensis TaxID=634462 RepID=A0A7Y9UM25_9ACTN|nr:hypothetical protein [Nocardioides daedukensis]NYG57088.1 hypothetical protein [Nocardioides daedukensis]
MLAIWYLRRAVPWAGSLSCLAVALALIAVITEWPRLVGTGLPAMVLLTGAAAGFAFDEAAVRVTSVTVRGTRWAPLARLLAALVLALGGAGLAVAAADEAVLDRSDWALLALALGGGTAVVAVFLGRHQVARPGSWIASALVLAGLTPLVLAMLVELRSPYPLEAWTSTLRTGWASIAVLGWVGAAWLAFAGRPLRHAQP